MYHEVNGLYVYSDVSLKLTKIDEGSLGAGEMIDIVIIYPYLSLRTQYKHIMCKCNFIFKGNNEI